MDNMIYRNTLVSDNIDNIMQLHFKCQLGTKLTSSLNRHSYINTHDQLSQLLRTQEKGKAAS